MLRRSGQQWIFDQFFRLAGYDLMSPGVLAFRLERGYRYGETTATLQRIKTLRQNSREWTHTAEAMRVRAEEAERQNHRVTARDFYYRASIYFGRAHWSILKLNEQKNQLLDACIACFDKVISLGDEKIERVVLDVDGEPVYGILHLPADCQKPVPAVIFFPGIDMFKEEFPGIGANEFAKRGMAILTLDGPGQGETRIKGVTVTDEKYMRAGKAALDFLERRPEIDRTRLAVSGASFGSYWAPHLAARDPRVKACAGIMGILYSMKAIFELAPPSFKLNYMFMAGIEDETEFDRVAATMGMQGLGQRINCPVLITQGEDDILCPVEGAEKFFAELAGPKEMWIFQNEHHALGGVIALVIPWLIDWLADAMNGQLPANHARRRDFTPI